MINPTDSITFLFTDIEGSTRLWEKHPEAMQVALARHDAILRQTIESHGGHVFKTVGDAFYAAFTSAPQAVVAALEAQRALHAEAQNALATDGPLIRVRMGLHSGAVEARDNDYFGPSVNRVSRLTSAGHGGQILLSAVTDEIVRGHLPPGAELRDMGEWRLRDLSRLEHIYQLLAPDLPAAFPQLRALDAFRTNLPSQLTSFVGREKEIVAINKLIATSRLTTLTGPGGTGKTRLSLRVASDLIDSFGNGVWFVELAPISDPALVTQTVMTTLGLREETGHTPSEILIDYLRAKTVLLILDNCEHLVAACAQLAETLLQTCPSLCLLVSSREALGIPGEAVYRVPSLAIPDLHTAQSAGSILKSEAACLFIDRAKSVAPAFAVSDENAAAIAKVCARLDGIPLAIELAAARVKILKVEQIAERLDDRFRLLTGGSRTALPRQQTLRALIDWSYDLLSETESSLLRRLSVFSGGWTLEAAEQVCGDDQLPKMDILDLLMQLVNKSLVVVDADEDTETRYRMLETIRQYAREKLFESDNGVLIRDQHLNYFMQLAERAEPQLTGPDQVAWLKHLQSELDNIHAALEWALGQNIEMGLRLASALRWFWITYDYLRDGSEQFTHLLAQAQALAESPARVKALTVHSILCIYLGDFSRACALAEESLAFYRAWDDRRGQADALFILGWAQNQLDNNVGSLLFEESEALYRTLADREGLARALWLLGLFFNDKREYARASVYLEESLALCRAIGNLGGISRALNALGWQAIWRNDYAVARARLEEALQVNRPLGKVRMAITIEGLGELAFRQGEYAQARVRLEESLSVMRESGQILYSRWLLVRLGYVTMRQGDAERARAIFAESQQIFQKSGEKIGVVYALEGLASMAVMQGQLSRAAHIFAWANTTRQAISIARPPVEQAEVDHDLATVQRQLDETTFAAAQIAGSAMSMDEAIAFALQTVDGGQ